MSVPCGLAPEDGLPVGLQIMAPVLADDRLYRVGAAVESGARAAPRSSAARGGERHRRLTDRCGGGDGTMTRRDRLPGSVRRGDRQVRAGDRAGDARRAGHDGRRCSAAARRSSAPTPNSAVCPVCLGLPGSLPVVNEAAIEYTIRIGLALNCSIASWCRFARKNYFYPDMPKDFQISQYDEPLCVDGWLDVEVGGKTVSGSASSGCTWKRTPASRCTSAGSGRIHGADVLAGRLQPGGDPAGRGGDQARSRHRGAGACRGPGVRDRAARPAARARGVGRPDGAGLAALRRQHLAGAAGLGGSGEPAPRRRTSTRCARSSARSGSRSSGRPLCWTRAAGSSRRPGTSTRSTGTTTAGRSKEEAQDYRYFPEPDLVPSRRRAMGRRRSARPARAARGEPGQAAGAVGAIGPRHDRVAQRGRAGPGRGDRGRGRHSRRGPQVVAGASCPGRPTRRASSLPRWPLRLPRWPGSLSSSSRVRSTTSWPVRCLRACWPERARPTRWWRRADWPWSATSPRSLGAIDAAIAANPDVVAKIAGGKTAAVGVLVGAVMKTTRGRADAARARELILRRLS